MSDKLATLTATEQNKLIGLERVIARTQATFIECGEALATIRDERLYRATHVTFEAYCKEKYRFSRSRAYALMAASEVAGNVSQCETFPMSQRAAEELSRVPSAERQKVADRATSNGKPLTAARVKAAAKEPATHVLDKTGTVIPPAILPEWERAEEWTGRIRQLSAIKCAVDDGLRDKDPLLSEVTNLTVANLINVGTDLKCILPYAVCWTCAGHKPARCVVCKGRGFVSKFRWDSICPEEIKQARKAVKR